MNPETLSALVQLVSALGGVAGVGAVFKIGIDRRRARADAEAVEVDASKVVSVTAVEMLGPLRDEVKALRSDLMASRAEASALRDEMRQLVEYINVLVGVIDSAGLPVPPRSVRPPPSPA